MVNLWNQLDVKLKTIGNIVDFKNEIKLYNLKNLIIGKDVCIMYHLISSILLKMMDFHG